MTALGVYRVATTGLSDFQAGRGSAKSDEARASTPSSASLVSLRESPQTPAPSRSVRRKNLLRVAQGYGRSYLDWGERSYRYRHESLEEDGDNDGRDNRWTGYRRSSGAYRTLCVRLCDGYYFPINFAVSRSRFERDAQTCERACPGQARLFVHPNPGGEAEDMVDLSGKRYRELKTAFLYRAEHVPSCRCKSDPWDADARLQHRMYALEAAARKGDAKAKVELTELTAKMNRERQEAASASASKTPPPASVADAPIAERPRRRPDADDTTERMGLGSRREVRERPSPSRGREADWISRLFGQ